MKQIHVQTVVTCDGEPCCPGGQGRWLLPVRSDDPKVVAERMAERGWVVREGRDLCEWHAKHEGEAERVIGCKRCAQPCALVGERIPEDGFCSSCREAER